jgi:MerR family regulatory protein
MYLVSGCGYHTIPVWDRQVRSDLFITRLDHDVTSCFILSSRKEETPWINVFIRAVSSPEKASVSVRTLRYYDKMGLLSPSQYTESGYRLYLCVYRGGT